MNWFAQFGKKSFLLIVAVYAVLALATLYGERRVEEGAREQLRSTLTGILDATHQRLLDWTEEQEASALKWARSPKVAAIAESLLEHETDPGHLRNAIEQEMLKHLLEQYLIENDYLGYFIISLDKVNLASQRPTNIGAINLLSDQSGLFDRVAGGDAVVSLPVVSDVPLLDRSGRYTRGRPSMFTIAPIRDGSGAVIAAFALRIAVSREFSNIFRSGRTGLSGETYAFDRHGYFVSESLFGKDLVAMGLVAPGESAVLNLRLQDPGTNLLAEHGTTGPRDAGPLTRMAESATAGERGVDLDGYRDYRGVPVVGAWLWEESLGFGMATEMDVEEAYASLASTKLTIYIVAAAVALLILAIVIISHVSNAKVRRNEARLRSVMENSADGIIAITADSRIELVNPAAARMFGYEPDELLGRKIEMLMPDAQRADHVGWVGRSKLRAARRLEDSRELVGLHKNGREVPIELTIAPLGQDGEARFVAILRDVGEQKLASQRFGRILDASLNEIYIFDAEDYHFVQVNQGARANIGYGMAELERLTPWAIKPEMDEAQFLDMIAPLRDGEQEVLSFESVHERKDGTTYPVEIHLQLFTDEARPIFVAIILDVTEREKADESRRESEQRFRATFDQAAVGIALAAPDGKFLKVNGKLTEILGYTDEELLALRFQDVTHAEDLETDLGYMHRLLRGTIQTYSMRKRYTRKDRALRWIHLTVSLVRDDDEKPKYLIFVVEDISEMVRTEQAVRNNERKLRAIMEGAGDAIFVFDGEAKILDANAQACKSLDYTKDEIRAMSMYEVGCAAELLEAADVNLSSSTSPPVAVETVNVRKNGTSFPVEALVSRLSAESGSQFLATIRDVTKRKQLEELNQLAAYQAEEANRAKSSFLARMSHELRTPLNAILLYTQMLIEDAVEIGADDFVPDLHKVEASGRHLLELINDVLDLSKIEAGSMALVPEDFPLEGLIDEVENIVRPLADKNSNIFAVTRPDALGSMYSDRTKLLQCLINFLSNAAKFTENGTVNLSIEREVMGDEALLRFTVTDTGIGMTEEQLGRIYEPFQQADSSISAKYGGTGLGLSITQKLIEKLGGTISAQSTLGEGTTFTIELPSDIRVFTEDPPAKCEASDVAEGPRRIAIWDSDKSAHDLLERLLAGCDVDIVHVYDGDGGLNLIRSRKPSLILLDAPLARSNDGCLIDELKQDPDLRDIPVVIASSRANDEIGDYGAVAEIITKPFEADAVEALLDWATSIAPATAVVEPERAA